MEIGLATIANWRTGQSGLTAEEMQSTAYASFRRLRLAVDEADNKDWDLENPPEDEMSIIEII